MISMHEKRLDFIKQTAAEITSNLKIENYPINMLEFLEQHYSDKYIVHYAEFSEKAEVVTNYYPVYNEAVILINEKYRQGNLLKRLNFSLAHEFGHIVLQHYRSADLDGLSPYYEKEADEFAGQFLIPEDEIYFMPKRLKFLSDYFFVSEMAISVRLEKMEYRRICAAQKMKEERNRYDENDLILMSLGQDYYEP